MFAPSWHGFAQNIRMLMGVFLVPFRHAAFGGSMWPHRTGRVGRFLYNASSFRLYFEPHTKLKEDSSVPMLFFFMLHLTEFIEKYFNMTYDRILEGYFSSFV